MFSKPFSPFQEQKTNKRVFQSEPEVLPCFELNYKFLEKHKKPLSLATTRKQEIPVKMAQKSKCKNKHEVEIKLSKVQTCTTYRCFLFANAMTVLTANF